MRSRGDEQQLPLGIVGGRIGLGEHRLGKDTRGEVVDDFEVGAPGGQGEIADSVQVANRLFALG